jgi:general secretion pathway protein E
MVQTVHPNALENTGALAAFTDRLLAQNQLTLQALERAQRAAETDGSRVDRVLNALGLVTDEAFVSAWAEVLQLPVAEATEFPSEPVQPEALLAPFLRYSGLLPLRSDMANVTIAVSDPLDHEALRAIAAKTGLGVICKIARPADMQRAFDRLYPLPNDEGATALLRNDDDLVGDVERLKDQASDAPVIRYVQGLIEQAVNKKASDVHLTLTRTGAMARLRIDGLLTEITPPAAQLYRAIVSRIKIMAELDIAESRLPQDGAIRIVLGGRELDLRVATMPQAHGEGAVLRILNRSSIEVDFTALGLTDAFVKRLKQVLAEPNGLVLMTGPTGSGKTTTLYAALKAIARPDRNIVTIEDPVEYRLDGLTQVEINPKIGFDFARALRAVLRQDPDVILVGEIRDQETAEMAIRAAMTGHLVLATIHTNSAAAALPRLIDMGIEPFLVASTVRAAMAQRLVRKLCLSCKSPVTEKDKEDAGQPSSRTRFTAKGCPTCDGSGYRGRLAVTEFLDMSPALRRLVAERADADTLMATAMGEGFVPMARDGADKVAVGLTTTEEVIRVVGDLVTP